MIGLFESVSDWMQSLNVSFLYYKHMFDIVIPVYNEAGSIDDSVRELREALEDSMDDYGIRIVDNQSSDDTFKHAQSLQSEFDEVTAMRIPQQGKARAIRAGWEASDADILGFIDVDLSPNVSVIPRMVDRVSTTKGLAVSSRHLPSSETVRTWHRSLVSHAYNTGLWVLTGSGVLDHQCGLKVLHRGFWYEVSSNIRSTEWFLDTELILHANRLGRRIDEFAVRWEEGPASAVNTVSVSWKILISLFRFWMRHGFKRDGAVVSRHRRLP